MPNVFLLLYKIIFVFTIFKPMFSADSHTDMAGDKVSSLLFGSKVVLSEAIAPICLPPTFMPRRLGEKTVTEVVRPWWKMTTGKETKI